MLLCAFPAKVEFMQLVKDLALTSKVLKGCTLTNTLELMYLLNSSFYKCNIKSCNDLVIIPFMEGD